MQNNMKGVPTELLISKLLTVTYFWHQIDAKTKFITIESDMQLFLF